MTERLSGNSQPPDASAGNNILPVIAVTTGEPAGIGPEICMAVAVAAAGHFPARLVFLGDRELLASRAALPGAARPIRDYRRAATPGPGDIEVLHCPLVRDSRAGHLDPANAPYVLGTLDRAIAGCTSGEFAAMVTAPVSKAVINDAGIAFTGHTEYLAAKAHTAMVVMLLVGGGLRVALATTHLSLADVPQAITREGLEATLRIIVRDLRQRFGIAVPRVLVAGLNPHAGEGGHLGREEIEVIAPAIARLRAEGLDVEGPIPADTVFVPARMATADCVLAMYHDQGLPVLKYASFGGGVNVTLGLPFIRTSVDHGTALDLAGSGRADAGSLIAAVKLACEMAARRVLQ